MHILLLLLSQVNLLPGILPDMSSYIDMCINLPDPFHGVASLSWCAERVVTALLQPIPLRCLFASAGRG